MTEHTTTESEDQVQPAQPDGQGQPDGQQAQPDGQPENAAPGDAANEDVLEALRDVVDPELGINVVDLGLVYGVELADDRAATIDMTLTSAACPLTDVIEDQAREALEGIVPDFRINWVWLPPWGPEKITEDGREQLRALGFNV
jgi:metal-sulfur cluster biosynthetic enzyme